MAGEVLAGVRRARRQLVDEGPALERAPNDFHRVSLPERDGDVLRDLFVAEKARAVIEVGLAYGSSALAISEALYSVGDADCSHIILDPNQAAFSDVGWKAIVAAGVAENCELIPERSQLGLPRLVDRGFVADAAFVDGSHIFHNVFVDLFFLRELVRPGGLVVLDDCDWPSVATALRYFAVNADWQAEPIGQATRLTAYRLPDPRVEPTLESFMPFFTEVTP